MSQRALIVIDIQNDYFPGGSFPLWSPEATLANIERTIVHATAQGIPTVLVQHIANPDAGIAPFFNAGTSGAAIHPRLRAAAPDAPVVVKEFADSFLHTALESTLDRLGARELLLCGMMTQNCVTHTALSRTADRYQVTILSDCCTSVSEMIHLIALHALSPRITLRSAGEALAIPVTQAQAS